MKHKILKIILVAIFLLPMNIVAADLQVWPNKEPGVYPAEFSLALETNIDDARIFWTSVADGSPADGLMFEEPITIARSVSLYFFAFTPEPQVETTPIQKVLYLVESRTGYEHLRIREVIPQTNTVILKNYSQFPVGLAGWQLESGEEDLYLEVHELASGEEISLELKMKSVQPQIMLRAPDGMAKQLASLPILEVDEEWRCESRRSSSCRVFEK